MGIGRVYIVGAGPGAADLLTIRGLRALKRAQVIVCDNLVPTGFFQELGVSLRGKRLIALGGRGSRRSQEAINDLLVREAAGGSTVVRLKSGDPLVFGRGAEEADYLSERGVPWEIVPGLTSALAGPGGARLPLTRRGAGRSFAVVTGRSAGGTANSAMPRADSVVVLMGVEVLDKLAGELIADGWPGASPAAVVERALQPWERRLHGPLNEIAGLAKAEGISSPAVLVVGQGADPRQRIASGPTVLFTGLEPSNFRALGDLIHWPALQVLPEPGAAPGLRKAVSDLAAGRFDWAVFTSRSGARSFMSRVWAEGLDARILGGVRVVAAGRGTAELLSEHGIRADGIPRLEGSEGILGELPESRVGRVLLIQGSHAPHGLPGGLRARGGRVHRVSLHRVIPHPELGRKLPAHDVVYFTSPSGVRAYHRAYGPQAFRKPVWCIGDVTLREAEKLGHKGKVVRADASDREATTAAVEQRDALARL
jgi:uroporphyrinogen III methyltransferase/synthase